MCPPPHKKEKLARKAALRAWRRLEKNWQGRGSDGLPSAGCSAGLVIREDGEEPVL